MSYHVVLKPPRGGPGEIEELARALAARYGAPAPAIAKRLAAGSLRVKTGVDLETARRYAADLIDLGGDAVVIDATSGAPWLDGASVAPAIEAAPAAPALDTTQQESAGGLGAIDDGSLTLATLDGQLEASGLHLDTGPQRPREASGADGDQFAPPPSGVTEDELLVVDDPLLAGRSEVAPAMTSAAAPGGDAWQDELPPPAAPPLRERLAAGLSSARRSLAERGRFHFAAGVIVAVLIGFPIAHAIASMQESTYAEVERDLRLAYAEARDPETHAGLVEIRAGSEAMMSARQTRIAVTGALIWLLTAAGAAALWFRVIRWERLAIAR